MAVSSRIEERRRRLTRRVLEIAAISDNHDHLLTLLETEFGKSLHHLGSGCFRRVYELPLGLVLKLQYKINCDDNDVEYNAAQRRPDLVAPVYGRFKCPAQFINVLVMRKARIEPETVWCSVAGEFKTKRARELADVLSDAHSYNMGFIGKRLVITDAGNGIAP